MKEKLYLITGAAGHLGGTIVRELSARGMAVRGLILPGEAAEATPGVRFYEGDITRPDTLRAFFDGAADSVCIHAAGIVSIARETTPELYDVNVNGTRNVLEACRKGGVRRMVYVSSVHAIPEAPACGTVTEVDSFSPGAVSGAYAKTKAEASQLVLNAVRELGMDCVIVHPSGILGPYDDGRNHIVQLIDRYLRGRLPAGVTGGFDFVDVRDVALGCIAAAERGTSGECYILSNRYCSIRGLLNYMRLSVRGPRKPCVPVKLAEAFAPLFEWFGRVTRRRPLFTRYALETLSCTGLYSHDKATMQLKYRPRDLKLTVADTIRWLKRPKGGGSGKGKEKSV